MHFSLTIFTHLLAKCKTIISFTWVTLFSFFFIGHQPHQTPFDSLSTPKRFPLNALHTDWLFCMKHQSLLVHVLVTHIRTHTTPHKHTLHTHLLHGWVFLSLQALIWMPATQRGLLRPLYVTPLASVFYSMPSYSTPPLSVCFGFGL